MSRAALRIVYFDCLDGVFDLENAALGREGVDASIVVGPEWLREYLELNMLDIFKLFLNYNLRYEKLLLNHAFQLYSFSWLNS